MTALPAPLPLVGPSGSGEVVYPDEFGAWTTASAISTAVYPPGTRYRAVLTDCKWCTDATRSGVLR